LKQRSSLCNPPKISIIILLSFTGTQALFIFASGGTRSDNTFQPGFQRRCSQVESGYSQDGELTSSQQTHPQPSVSQSTSLLSILKSIIHLLNTERSSTLSDLDDITRELLKKQQKAERAFMMVQYLYTLSQRRSPPIAPEGPDSRWSVLSGNLRASFCNIWRDPPSLAHSFFSTQLRSRHSCEKGGTCEETRQRLDR